VRRLHDSFLGVRRILGLGWIGFVLTCFEDVIADELEGYLGLDFGDKIGSLDEVIG
jgi:hypothetical protein